MRTGVASQVYFNRNRKVWSVRQLGRVVAHVDRLCMVDCKMKVSERMRSTLLATRKRTVHAWITGVIVSSAPEGQPLVEIRYEPFSFGYFFTKDGLQPVMSSAMVTFANKGRCFALISEAATSEKLKLYTSDRPASARCTGAFPNTSRYRKGSSSVSARVPPCIPEKRQRRRVRI